MLARMTERAATCHCRALRLACAGEPYKVSMCHCIDCQRRTGSAFSVAAFYPREAVRIEGATHSFERDSASGNRVRFHFCPDCGSNLFWESARMPHLIGVALGGFEDPGFPAPEQAVWARDRHAWVAVQGDIPHFEENPTPRPQRRHD